LNGGKGKQINYKPSNAPKINLLYILIIFQDILLKSLAIAFGYTSVFNPRLSKMPF